MSALRARMIEDMQLRGLAKRTQESYVRAVRQLAEYYDRSPAELSNAEIRAYFLYLSNERQAARGTCSIAYNGIKFLYRHTLKREWSSELQVRLPKEKKQPVVFSRAEVKQLLRCVRLPPYRVCLGVIYSCGLRLKEGTQLEVAQIDSQRMVLTIRSGKGGKDRTVPLAQPTLEMLRQHWASHRHPRWLFPSYRVLSVAQKPVNASSVQKAFRGALQESGIRKQASVHTLRHSYATHLFEAGVEVRLIQRYLGHTSLNTTLRYTHLTAQTEEPANAIIADLMAELT